jgi:hypothetical protein
MAEEPVDIGASQELMVEECASEVVNVGTQTAHSELLQESSITQIHASREEMYRRIEAFCKHKRSQIDVNNVIEYTKPTARENTCARVDAVRVYTANSRRVERIHNVVGPNPKTPTPVEHLREELLAAEESYRIPRTTHTAQKVDVVEERLRSLEEHLDCDGERGPGTSTMERLRTLEQRLLQLEASSPEYAQDWRPDNTPSSNPKPNLSLHKKTMPRIVFGHPANTL